MTEPDRTLAAAVELHQAGRLDDAEAVYRALVDADPDHADALHLLGLIAHQRGDAETALGLIERAVELNGSDPRYHANLGRVRHAAGDDAGAVAAYGRALELQPDDAEVGSDLAAALIGTGDHSGAADACRRALELDPELAAARTNLVAALQGLGDDLQEAGDFEAAIASYKEALELDEARVEAWCNLGNARLALFDFEAAIKDFRRALDIDPQIAEVRSNLGVALQEAGDLAGALASYARALKINPDDPECRRNNAQALLQAGRFEDGWREFEWRWKTKHFAAIRRDWAAPQWRGQAFDGKTLLVHAEQGFGDCLQFARYLPLAAERGGRVVVECAEPLVELMERVDGVSEVAAAGAGMPPHDLQVPMMSLPGVFATDFSNMPAAVPYLSVPETAAGKWKDAVGGNGLQVGIAWKGSPKHKRNLWRSPGLGALAPLLEVEGVRFHSLQVEGGADDLAAMGLADAVADPTPGFESFADTATVVDRLDLVVSPDTAVAHLAGALGRPVWLMLPHAADDSPWYPTMRLFRQRRHGDWAGVVARIKESLTERRDR